MSAGSLAPKPPRRGRKLGLAASLLGLAAISAATVVIRIQTGEGDVVVESEVDGVSLDILRNGQPVKDDWQIHAGGDNRWHVRTGKVEVRLPANLQGEFTLDQDTARLVRDGKILVKITRKKKADATTVASDDPRAVAEWALEHGVPIAIVTTPGALAFPITSVEQLPRSFDLHSLGFPWPLKPPRPPISEEEFITQVRRLRGNLIWLGEGLRPLRTLRWLDLLGASSRDLAHLAELPQLRTIWLYDEVAIDEGDRAELARKNPLCRLIVGHAPAKSIGEDRPRALAERLQKRGATLDLQFYADFWHSQDVHSNDAPVLIETINLPPQFALDDEDHRLLAALDYPMSFSAPGVAEADRCAAALGETPTLLKNLDLSDSGLTDEGLARLSTQPMLERLHIRGTKVTTAGVEAFKKALPDCNVDWQPPIAGEDPDRAVTK